jgi:hypothetical protein
MSTNAIAHPKIVIVASILLMCGVVAIGVLELRPDSRDAYNYVPRIASHTASKPTAPGGAAPAGKQAAGGVKTQGESYASVTQILDAVKICLDRNDLESARLLLDAELVIHKDDARVQALQRELQAREASRHGAPTVARADTTPAVPPLPPAVTARPAGRVAPSRYAESSPREHEASASRYTRTRYTPRVDAVATHAKGVDASSQPATVWEARAVSSVTQPVSAASVMSQPVLEAAPVAQSAPVSPPAPVTPTAQSAQVAPSAQPAQPTQPVTMVAQSGQGPKTRAEVREELERARSDGDLPRFGNPDPAGPGGAMSMTVNPGPASH